MGSCRMAVNSKDGPTKPTGELHDVDNLYVADASVFPTSLGINPMITIEAIAHMTAKNIVKRLEGLI